jgi:hypothetical protein
MSRRPRARNVQGALQTWIQVRNITLTTICIILNLVMNAELLNAMYC